MVLLIVNDMLHRAKVTASKGKPATLRFILEWILDTLFLELLNSIEYPF